MSDRLRYQKQAMEYLLMTHYNMTLKDVREMNINDAKQLLYWAQAMQGEEQAAENAVIWAMTYWLDWRKTSGRREYRPKDRRVHEEV